MAETVDALVLGAIFAVLGAASMLIIGIVAWQWELGVSAVQAIAGMSPGYGPSLIGSLIGAMWGALDGFILGMLIGGLYNHIQNTWY